MSPVQSLVLVVEDDPVLRGFETNCLREEGFDVVGVEDGLPALTVAARRQPSVILLDMHTPRMSGEEFARAYHALPGPHAPLVLVSADRAIATAAEEMGADGFLSKPFDIDDLLEVVARHAVSGSGNGDEALS
ncbi:MAG TPA: response regulator [Chloroflexota bacterium]|nr:response regulator [Chloroflexota bacterium]